MDFHYNENFDYSISSKRSISRIDFNFVFNFGNLRKNYAYARYCKSFKSVFCGNVKFMRDAHSLGLTVDRYQNLLKILVSNELLKSK